MTSPQKAHEPLCRPFEPTGYCLIQKTRYGLGISRSGLVQFSHRLCLSDGNRCIGMVTKGAIITHCRRTNRKLANCQRTDGNQSDGHCAQSHNTHRYGTGCQKAQGERTQAQQAQAKGTEGHNTHRE